jgi:hypothetical protein
VIFVTSPPSTPVIAEAPHVNSAGREDLVESAIEEIPDRDVENKKRALYLAGRLAMALKDVDTAERHLTALAGLDFSYRDVWTMLKPIAKLRPNPESALAQNGDG